MKIKHKIWLERNDRVIFGQGRDELLKAIEECHSLNAAAKKLKMSYRAAWGRLRASEQRLGVKLVEVPCQGDGMRLTNEGRALLNFFERLEADTETFLSNASQRLALITKKTLKDKNTVTALKLMLLGIDLPFWLGLMAEIQ
ncbi:MAG: LysR family transcriptional regulator [Smithellaceae bacterium]|nr:LysR family transcriptional regulator [Smithellaceae bacterium]